MELVFVIFLPAVFLDHITEIVPPNIAFLHINNGFIHITGFLLSNILFQICCVGPCI